MRVSQAQIGLYGKTIPRDKRAVTRVIITGRHVEITDALRRYIETRMKRLERYGVTLGKVQVVVGVEKYRHTAEVILTLNGVAIQGRASTNEMYASIDRLLDKISSQVRKRKEKRINHKSRAVERRSMRTQNEAEGKPLGIKTIRVPLHTLTVAEAIGRLGKQPSALVVFVNAAFDRLQVIRRLDHGGVELIDPQPV